MFTTPLTERLGLRVPILAAPLGRGSGPRFLQAVANAGALGFVGVLHMEEHRVHGDLAEIVDATGGQVGVNATLIQDQHRHLQAALDVGIRVVSLWQGDPAPYIPMVKDRPQPVTGETSRTT